MSSSSTVQQVNPSPAESSEHAFSMTQQDLLDQLNAEKESFEAAITRFQSDAKSRFDALQHDIVSAPNNAESLSQQRLNMSQQLNAMKQDLIDQISASFDQYQPYEAMAQEQDQQMTFLEQIQQMTDRYDRVTDSISARTQTALTNVTNRRSMCQRKIVRLQEQQKSAESGETLDQSVLESETSRVKAYDQQIEDLKNAYDRNQQINEKLLGQIRTQLGDALKLQRNNSQTRRNSSDEQGATEVNDDQYYDEEEDLDGLDNILGQGDHRAQEAETEEAPPLVVHRLTPKINDVNAADDDNSNSLQFDWPTDRDLSELMATHAAEGKDLSDIQIIGVNNNRYLQRFNFVLGNGWRSSLQARVRMFETLVQPSGSRIKKICVYYTDRHEKSGLKNGLYGLIFRDETGADILVAGDVKEAKGLKLQEIELEDDERVIGVKSRLNKGYPAFHQDVQFKICKI